MLAKVVSSFVKRLVYNVEKDFFPQKANTSLMQKLLLNTELAVKVRR